MTQCEGLREIGTEIVPCDNTAEWSVDGMLACGDCVATFLRDEGATIVTAIEEEPTTDPSERGHEYVGPQSTATRATINDHSLGLKITTTEPGRAQPCCVAAGGVETSHELYDGRLKVCHRSCSIHPPASEPV